MGILALDRLSTANTGAYAEYKQIINDLAKRPQRLAELFIKLWRL